MGNTYSITEVLQSEEEIFSEQVEEIGSIENLITSLFEESGPSVWDIAQGDFDEFENGDAELVLRDSFYDPNHNKYQYNWEAFTYTVKHINRFFDVKENLAREELLSGFDDFFKSMAVDLERGYRIWRGRLDPQGPYETSTLQIKECGPPPRKSAISLRMNPAGISYFYGAEDLDTAVKEIRAKEGTTSIYGEFKIIEDLRVVDFSVVPKVQIPSVFSEDYDHELLNIQHFLNSFGKEISKPIIEEEAQIEYLPTQILTEYIRASGYDGVRYRSSLTTGYNVTLFCGPRVDYSEKLELELGRDQIPVFTDWLDLIDFKIGETRVAIDGSSY